MVLFMLVDAMYLNILFDVLIMNIKFVLKTIVYCYIGGISVRHNFLTVVF